MSVDPQEPALSVVVPVYDEEDNVAPLHAEITAVARSLGRAYEILFVNDGSRDATLERLHALAAGDPQLRVIDLDGNFGEASALSAGFAYARGAVVVTMDGDGQNPPSEIPRLLAALGPDVDVVSGRRAARQEALSRVLPSRIANWLIARVTGVPVYDCGCGLKAYRRQVLHGAELPRGMNRFLPAILGVDPARVREVPVADRSRHSGASHYGLWRIAVVLRDLPSLPLLVRRPLPGRAVGRALAAAAGLSVAGTLAALVAAARQPHAYVLDVGLALGTALVAIVLLAVRHNVDRFARAREHGVFRVRRAREHRDRGRWVLGQEPAPHLRPR